MPRWVWIAAGALVLLAAGVAVAHAQTLKRLTRSTKAAELGVSNAPDSDDDKRRLLYLDKVQKRIVAVLSEQWPGIRLTSAYRNDVVNGAVGGVKTSYHRYGQAADFGVSGVSDYQPLAKFLAANVARVGFPLRTIYAETTPPHLHVEVYDPLKKNDKGQGPLSLIAEPAGGGKAFALT